jgi:hypothetical protein
VQQKGRPEGRPSFLATNYAARLRGTFAPSRRASERPIAIACLRLFTLRPLPDFSFPRLNSCISSPTFSCALRPYFLPELRRPRVEAVVRRRERDAVPERRPADFARVFRRDVAVVPFRRRDVAVPRLDVLRRERVPRDFVDEERERVLEVDLRVAIISSLLHSQTIRAQRGLRSLSDWLHPVQHRNITCV